MLALMMLALVMLALVMLALVMLALALVLPLGFSTALGHFRACTIPYLGFASQRLV